MSDLSQQIEIYRKAYRILAKKIKRREIEEKVKELKLKKMKHRKPADKGKNISRQKNSDSVADSSDEEIQLEKTTEKSQNTSLCVYNCKVCETNYRTEENLRLHEKTHLFKTKKKWSCGSCLYNFVTEARLKLHNCSGKGNSGDELVLIDQLYSCSDCFAAYKKQEDLVEHRKVNHLSKFVCNVCSKSFMFKVALDKHMLVHIQTKEYHCKMCNKICKTETALKAHNVVHKKDILNVAFSGLKSNNDSGTKNKKSISSSKESTLGKAKHARRGKKTSVTNEDSDIEELESTDVEVPTFNLECVDGNETDKYSDFHSNSSSNDEDSDASVTYNIPNLTARSPNKKRCSSRVAVKTNIQPVVKVLKLATLENTSNTLPIKLPVNLNLGEKKPKCQLCYATFNSKEELIDHIEIHLGGRIELRNNTKNSISSSSPSTSLNHDQSILTSNSKNAKKKRGRPSKLKDLNDKTKVNKQVMKADGTKKRRGRPPNSVTMPVVQSIFDDSTEMEQEINGQSLEHAVFDPNYIIKVEPEDSSELYRDIDLDVTFITLEGNKRVKVSNFLRKLPKPVVDLSLYNMLVV